MFAPAFWYKKTPSLTAYALWPVAALYAAGATLHGKLRAKHPYFAGVPVISVGNLVVGGAGKTPVVQWLAAHYASQGHQVAILSRGYGGQATQPMRVSERFHTAQEVGDEPLALARHFVGQSVTIWVGRNRAAVARRAEEAGATLLILDDGFQRRDVARTCDILVINGQTESPWGNGLTLPAGPLREPLKHRSRAHFAIVLNEPESGTLPYYGLPAYRLQTQLTEASLAPLHGKPLVAFAGLAHPEKFMKSLAANGLKLAAAIAFPDHHAYTPKNLTYLKQRAAEAKGILVTTTKDAAKLPQGFAYVVEQTLTGPQQTDILTDIDQRLTAV
ncbi:MAG: tetraacyldisaccharide 4'-kinase [Blastochloris viridis]|uniref:Tetraacyldisaccharide 4'-kinase n=1 Tax=Blastochloris viridis TaxID=1079 RepID=A0A6N4R5B8_BLAVI|nr:MAG: tetraacyldisaccharide 4'-kinase [Blastochloris viridis]